MSKTLSFVAMLLLAAVSYSQVNYVGRVFLPDAPQTPNSDSCVIVPVTVNQFMSGETVESITDISSICVNMEHSYMGDLMISIVCPNGSEAVLKGDVRTDSIRSGSGGFMGLPYGGNNHPTWDPTNQVSDSVYNPYGVGWNYCWSLDNEYDKSRGYIGGSNYIQLTYNFASLPQGFQSSFGPAGMQTFSTTDSSDYANKSGYYLPTGDFTTLVGCPLNGEWAIKICDLWSPDNGWLFGWSMDLKGEQTVGIAQSSAVEVKMYPNPAADKVLVESENLANVTMYNTLGQQVTSQDAVSGKVVIPVSDYPKGSYVLRIQTADGKITSRSLVIKK
ncbi:MAG: T9SS type A sorting domain-containing protein [Bacteroidales bacterium]|nr:T9SS type A sorting domain-containing protein [Bacteroidales bacterium]